MDLRKVGRRSPFITHLRTGNREPDTDAVVLGDHHDFERPRVTKRSRLQARTTDSSSFGP